MFRNRAYNFHGCQACIGKLYTLYISKVSKLLINYDVLGSN